MLCFIFDWMTFLIELNILHGALKICTYKSLPFFPVLNFFRTVYYALCMEASLGKASPWRCPRILLQSQIYLFFLEQSTLALFYLSGLGFCILGWHLKSNFRISTGTRGHIVRFWLETMCVKYFSKIFIFRGSSRRSKFEIILFKSPFFTDIN